MSLRGTSLRSRSRLACLTLVVGLAGGLIAPAAAASTSTPEPTATAVATSTPTATPTPTAVPTAAPTATPQPTGTATPTATATATATATPTATPTPVETPVTTPTASPAPIPGTVTFDGAISVSTAPGTITLAVPARSATGPVGAASIFYRIAQDGGVGVALDTVEQVPAEGLPPRIIEVALPYSDDWTVSVSTAVDGSVFQQTVTVLSAFDTCAAGLDRSQTNEPFTVDAVAGVGRIDVTVGALTLADCFDELEFRVLVKLADGNDEQEGVELGPLRSDSTFDGATVSGSFAPGRYFVVVLAGGVVDGESGGLFQVFAPSVNQPDDEREFLVVTAAKTTTTTATTTSGGTRLADTGSDAAGAATGAAALLLAGFTALVIARRRTAQRS
ncbi:hypothetical protein [Rathayibacter sp. VKM Ac-2804]|uniref:hypothetical protein n=1 Tax=Rathayibacter sp. VKM Ac-2804 TaxID=2609257 RepID=UPI001ABE6B77|nr:hypothetical protein [Rathayibacter sp. VKM Ac-2804]